MASVLFSRPKHDTTLSYLYYSSKELISLSVLLGHKTINKEKEKADEKNIRNVLEKQKPNLVIFNGHGSPESICGHNDEVLISTIKNINLLKEMIIYSLSCCSALILGKESVRIGTRSFIGYDWDFTLGKDPNSEASPRRDKISKLFLESSNILVHSLLKGNCVKDAVDKAKNNMKENIWYLSTTEDFPEASDYAPFLFSNYTCLNIKGDEKASISQSQ